MLAASYASASPSLADPAGSNAIVAAVAWLEATLLGTAATTIAVIAVSWIGFGMLAGRVNIRRRLTVILGCFLLFGASTIVTGIRSSLAGDSRVVRSYPPPSPPPAIPPPPPPRPYDPYAGASVPAR
jgi:type IV secretion system protein VirB2